jgi:hypothetical protein
MSTIIHEDPYTQTIIIKTDILSKQGKLLEVRVEHGEQHGAPDTTIHVLELPDGSIVERCFSVTEGQLGRIISGFTERRL